MRLLVLDCTGYKRKKSDGKGEESDEMRENNNGLT